MENSSKQNENPEHVKADVMFRMNKVDFVAFICVVINGSEQVQSI